MRPGKHPPHQGAAYQCLDGPKNFPRLWIHHYLTSQEQARSSMRTLFQCFPAVYQAAEYRFYTNGMPPPPPPPPQILQAC